MPSGGNGFKVAALPALERQLKECGRMAWLAAIWMSISSGAVREKADG